MQSEAKVMAHDINNQLQVVRIYLWRLKNELFKPSLNKEELTDLNRLLETGINKVAVICREVLDGEEQVEVGLGSCIQEALKFCDSFDVEVELFKYRDPVIKIFPTSFERVLINLFKNSIESSADKILIELRESSIIIKDNGGGISDEQILEFKRGEYKTTKIEGYGFGIDSLYDFCRKMKWELEISNYKFLHEINKKGTKIHISLPKMKDNQDIV